jgi:hypothetical protein
MLLADYDLSALARFFFFWPISVCLFVGGTLLLLWLLTRVFGTPAAGDGKAEVHPKEYSKK